MSEVVVRGLGGLGQEIETRGHHLLADEPPEAGGDDAGPTPYELLLSALGACTSMTIRLYAQRKGWAIGEVQVRLRHERIHAADCADCETRDGYLDRIYKEVLVQGQLSAEQLQRLAEIARRCPVQQTLSHEINVVDSLSGSAGEADGLPRKPS
jgi:putative redox protein